MDQSIQDNGKEIRNMDMERKHGKMELVIQVPGKMVKLMVMESLCIQTEIDMKVIGN